MLINDKKSYIKMFLEFREHGYPYQDLVCDLEACDVIDSKGRFYTKEYLRNEKFMFYEKMKGLLCGDTDLGYYKNRRELLCLGMNICLEFHDYYLQVYEAQMMLNSKALSNMEKFIFWQFMNIDQTIAEKDMYLTSFPCLYLDDVIEAREAFSDFYDGVISHVETIANVKIKK